MTPPPGVPDHFQLSSEQEERLRAVPASLDWQAADERLLEEMAARIESVLSTRVLIFCRQDRSWSTIRADEGAGRAMPAATGVTDPLFDLNAIEPGSPVVVRASGARGDTHWTLV